MALPATDTFTAANGTALTTYSANWSYVANTFAINTNAVHPTNNSDSAARWNADTFADDQYSTATVVAIAANVYIGLSVRCASGANTHYGFTADATDGSYLYKYVAGSFTQLGSTGGTFSTSQVIRLEASGTTITPYRAGSTSGTPGPQTDISISSGSAGIAGAGNSSSSRLDDWEGGILGGGGGRTTFNTDSHPLGIGAGISRRISGI